MRTNTRRLSAVTTTSWLAIGLAMAGTGAMAQTAGSSATGTNATGDNTVSEVIVVGARASQQSSIDRKKRASTPTDSIVAEDVGSFPDRSINEAISRVAGTALNRNAFGEGEGVSIRGASMGQTRVELDGMGVQSTYGLALGTAGGRSADMRELPSDLIKSVDIVKGATADMTEGSLSGGVKIQTRSGLDFKKPYLSIRVGAESNSVTEKWTPDYNLVASRKFLDGRLGVIFNGSYREVENVSHTQETAGSNGQDGDAVLWDWDNSAEKTYTFNPALVGGSAGDVVLANSTETPRTLLAKSAAATTKQACIAAFPFLDTGSDVGKTNAQIATANAQKTERLNEQYTCLNQWNDLAPNNIRQFMNSQADKRDSVDLRFDYRVSDSLTVFAKVNHSERITDDQNRSRTLGNPDVNPAGRFFTTNGTATVPSQRYVVQDGAIGTPGAVGTGAGYFNWTLANLLPTAPSCPTITSPGGLCPGGVLPGATSNPMIGRGVVNGQVLLTDGLGGTANQQDNQAAYIDDTNAQTAIPVRGMVTNIDPASVKVDANHQVISYDQYNNSVSINQIDNYQPSKTDYVQVGGDFNGERSHVEFMAGMTKASSSRIDLRTARSYNYGKATISLSPDGIWEYALPSTYDDSNPNNFVQLTAPITAQAATVGSDTNLFPTPAYTIAQRPLTTPNFAVTARPRVGESTEKVAKVDLTYDLSDFSPVLKRVKTGLNFRNNVISAWGGGGRTIQSAVGTYNTALTRAQNIANGYVPGIYLPGANQDGSYRACQETPTSALIDDGIKGSAETSTLGLCNFGYVQTNPTVRYGQDTLTADQLRALFVSTTEVSDQRFFNSYKTSTAGWNGIQTGELFAQLGNGQFSNLDCIKQCVATDGKVYDAPLNQSEETTIAAYYMLDYEVENLPFGMTFDGNLGIRGVHTDVKATGFTTLQNVRVVGRDVNGADITDTRTFQQNTEFQAQSMDWLPSYNANLWIIPDQVVVRYFYGKQLSRPDVGQLLPGGTCIIDERNNAASPFFDGTDDSVCNNPIGNPDLDPLRAINQSVNLEWYPNRDTSVSLVYQKADILVGGGRQTTVTGPVFANSTQTDPLTGAPLSDLVFRYPTYENAPGFQRSGLEFTAKTAFTFLPWLFRYTGADFNISTLKATTTAAPEIDPITGDAMDPRGQSEYYTNLSLWYDDGKAQVRVSYQGRAESFNGITPLSGSTNRNFPTENNVGVAPPYYPGQPQFTDETKYWDAKASYNVNDNVQVYLEGTNLTKQAQTYSTGEYRTYADGTPHIQRIAYSGMRVRAGVTFKFQ